MNTEERRSWLRGQLEAAALRFGVELAGEVVNGHDVRSAGARARERGRDEWLRVVVEEPGYHSRWNGNVEAGLIRGVPKPRVLRWSDWTGTGGPLAGRRVRGEVMTFAPGATVAPSGVLADAPPVPESWWHALAAALDALAAHPVGEVDERGVVAYTTAGVRDHFGVELPAALFADLRWTTAHADLHWGNLRGPRLSVLDWESWRPAPTGYDAATLYCNSLLHPPTAERLRDLPVFGTRHGQIALLFAIVRYLWVDGRYRHLHRLNELRRVAGAEILADLGHPRPARSSRR